MAVTKAVAACNIEGARAAAMPAALVPQLPILAAAVPSGAAWLHEIKYDGYRIVARLVRGIGTLLTRSGKDWTARFPTIAAALGGLGVQNALLDGEVVHEEPDGVTSFSLLARDLAEGRSEHLVYHVFDLPYIDGCSLAGARLEDRKQILQSLLAPGPAGPIRGSRHVAGNGAAFYAQCCAGGLEGVVSKRRDAPYCSGHGHGWSRSNARRARNSRSSAGPTPPAAARASARCCSAVMTSRETSTMPAVSAPGSATPSWVGSGAGWSNCRSQRLRPPISAPWHRAMCIG